MSDTCEDCANMKVRADHWRRAATDAAKMREWSDRAHKSIRGQVDELQACVTMIEKEIAAVSRPGEDGFTALKRIVAEAVKAAAEVPAPGA